jgi:hypothetical protein
MMDQRAGLREVHEADDVRRGVIGGQSKVVSAVR